MWATEDVLANPQQGELLADTGALTLGAFAFTVVLWGETAGGLVEIARRNATNTADVKSQVVSVPSDLTIVIPFPVSLSLNERLVARLADNYSGQMQASILW